MLTWKKFRDRFESKIDDLTLREIYAVYCRDLRIAIEDMVADLSAELRDVRTEENSIYEHD